MSSWCEAHGIKLTAAVQHHASDGVLCEAYMTTTPRGFSLESGAFMSSYPMQSKFTVDYAFPFAPVGWSWLCPAAYVRNFEMTLHADYGLYSADRSAGTSLFSAGADLTARLGNFLWIPYDTRIGVEYEHLRYAGHYSSTAFDTHDMRYCVKGSEVNAKLQLFENFGGNECAFEEVRAAVDNSVTDSFDFGNACETTLFGVCQRVNNELSCN